MKNIISRPFKATLILVAFFALLRFGYSATQTINTLPSADATFIATLQTFLGNELASYMHLRLPDSITSGGIGSTSANLTHTIPEVIGFPSGFYTHQAATSHTYSASSRTFVYLRANNATTYSIPGASITYDDNYVFATMAAGSSVPTTPSGLLPLMYADTSGAAITAITETQVTYTPIYTGDYAVDTGSANTYVVALSPVITSYKNGQWVSFRATHANTGASTLDAGGGAKAIKTRSGSALSSGDIPVNSLVTCIYDLAGDYFLFNSISLSQLDARYAQLAGSASQTFSMATQTSTDSTTKGATTSFVHTVADAKVASVTGTANKVSVNNADPTNPVLSLPADVALTGVSTAPKAAYGTNTTQIASTSFVQDAISSGSSLFGTVHTTLARTYDTTYTNSHGVPLFLWFKCINAVSYCTLNIGGAGGVTVIGGASEIHSAIIPNSSTYKITSDSTDSSTVATEIY